MSQVYTHNTDLGINYTNIIIYKLSLFIFTDKLNKYNRQVQHEYIFIKKETIYKTFVDRKYKRYMKYLKTRKLIF